jgi:hypothetical protein
MDRSKLEDAARTLGASMSRMAGSGVFAGTVGTDDARELFAFTHALNLPVEDGRHLAGVVHALSVALLTALQRRTTGS